MWEVVCQRAFFLHLWCILATGYYLNNEGSILHLFMQTQRSQENKMIHLSPFSDIILFMDICLKSNPQNCVNPIIDGPSKIDGSWLVLINQSSGKNIFMLPTFTDFHIFQPIFTWYHLYSTDFENRLNKTWIPVPPCFSRTHISAWLGLVALELFYRIG